MTARRESRRARTEQCATSPEPTPPTLLAVTIATSSDPSSGSASGNTVTPPKSDPTFPARMHVTSPLNHFFAVDLDSGPDRTRRRCFAPVHTYAARPKRSFRRAVGITDHGGVEPGAGHHREVLAVHETEVERAAPTSEPDVDGGLDVFRDAEVRRRQFAVPAGITASGPVPPIASAHRCTMPSPPHTKSSSAPSFRARRTLRRLPALGYLEPQASDAAVVQTRRSSSSPPPSSCPMCDDCDCAWS